MDNDRISEVIDYPDPAVAAALALLSSGPDQSSIDVQSLPRMFGRATAAQIDQHTRRISVNRESRAYRDAARGRPIELAAVLVHEQWHLQHGRDEGAAYDAQIRALQALGASRALLREVQDAKQQVLTPPARRR